MKQKQPLHAEEHAPLLEALADPEHAPNGFHLDYIGNAPAGNLNNAVTLLEHDPLCIGVVWFDEFLQRIMTGDPVREWKDADDLELTLYMQRQAGILKMRREIVSQAVILIAQRNRRNCVKGWMDGLVWDGEPRINHFFEDHFGADATAYTRAVSQNFWLSLIARIYLPGCKVDSMVILEGPQGSFKSSALLAIGGDWFAEQHEAVTGHGFFEVLQGKFLIEISEMDSFSRAEVTKVKQVVSCLSDRYRESYGRHAKDHPRQCVFVGTTNRDDWNRDETGARRFWPIACKDKIDVDMIRKYRDQFFAEALQRYSAGEKWWEMPNGETVAEQQKRYDPDAWTEFIAEYIGLRQRITVNEILRDCLKFDASKIAKSDQMRVTTCLRVLGWERRLVREGDRVQRAWFTPEVVT